MESCGCKSVKELDWWQESKIEGKEDVTFACVPAQHWCRRTALDGNKVRGVMSRPEERQTDESFCSFDNNNKYIRTHT